MNLYYTIMVKFYEIVCNETDERYIGSTGSTLKRRLWEHEYFIIEGKCCSSKQIIERKNYKINLIEEIPNLNNTERLERERYWYDILPNVINSRSPCGRLINPSQKAKLWRQKQEPYHCIICNINLSMSNKSRHIKTFHTNPSQNL